MVVLRALSLFWFSLLTFCSLWIFPILILLFRPLQQTCGSFFQNSRKGCLQLLCLAFYCLQCYLKSLPHKNKSGELWFSGVVVACRPVKGELEKEMKEKGQGVKDGTATEMEATLAVLINCMTQKGEHRSCVSLGLKYIEKTHNLKD